MKKIRETPSPMYMALSNERFPSPGVMSDGTIILHADTSRMYIAQSSVQPQSDPQVPLGGWTFLANANLNVQFPSIGDFRNDGGLPLSDDSIQRQSVTALLTQILRELQVQNLLLHSGFTSGLSTQEDLNNLRDSVAAMDPLFTLT